MESLTFAFVIIACRQQKAIMRLCIQGHTGSKLPGREFRLGDDLGFPPDSNILVEFFTHTSHKRPNKMQHCLEWCNQELTQPPTLDYALQVSLLFKGRLSDLGYPRSALTGWGLSAWRRPAGWWRRLLSASRWCTAATPPGPKPVGVVLVNCWLQTRAVGAPRALVALWLLIHCLAGWARLKMANCYLHAQLPPRRWETHSVPDVFLCGD